MNSFLDEKEPEDNKAISHMFIYANVCLSIISVSLLVISVCLVMRVFSEPGNGKNSIRKISICDPETNRCVKVNAGRRLETTN